MFTTTGAAGTWFEENDPEGGTFVSMRSWSDLSMRSWSELYRPVFQN